MSADESASGSNDVIIQWRKHYERRFSCAVSAGLVVLVSFSILLKLYYPVNCKCPIKRVLFIGELPICCVSLQL